jgi:hypothetical protein
MKATQPDISETKVSKVKDEAAVVSKAKRSQTASAKSAAAKATPEKAAPAKATTTKAASVRSAAEVAASQPGTVKKPAKKNDTGAKPVLVFDLQAMIEIEAYLRAEQRGFAPGRELDDWLEAEQAVLNQLGQNGSYNAVEQ